jgi:glyoxylase-like metal-dependent hydrolase (beta-lactamase superfamily II)
MEPILVPIRQDVAGLQGFTGSWICGRDPNIITDIGPASSVKYLVEDLSKLHFETIDFVLISHIHVDHAGGLSEFLDRFPMARIICHSKGIRHLVDPGRLWEASLKTLGDLARAYGEVRPVDADRLIPHTQAAVPGLRVIETPGHAAHHLSFVYRGNLFVGEAAGVYYRMENREYLRCATPAPFFLEETLKSIDRLHDLEDQPICFAHIAKGLSSKAMLARARDQILRWQTTLEGEISKGRDELALRCMQEILARDPEVRSFQAMGTEEQDRERFFLVNSIKGFLEYLSKQ